MYVLRFKRHKQEPLYLTVAEHSRDWDLTVHIGHARAYGSVEAVKQTIEAIQRVVIPKRTFEFTERTLFLIRLFGSTWDDQVEGMLVDMDGVIKAQVVHTHALTVQETVRLRNPVWETHYA